MAVFDSFDHFLAHGKFILATGIPTDHLVAHVHRQDGSALPRFSFLLHNRIKNDEIFDSMDSTNDLLGIS